MKSSKVHRAAALFTISQEMLNFNIKLYLVTLNEAKFELHQLPTQVVGSTVVLDEDLIKLLVEKSKKRVFVQMNYVKEVGNPLTMSKSKCQV